MNKLFLLTLAMLTAFAGYTQNDKYTKAMEARVVALDTTWNVQGLTDLANAFERIGAAEKTQWLPYYYAALAYVNSGYASMNAQNMSGGLADKVDPIADKAEALLKTAEGLTKENSELYVVRKMIATLRMMADPMNRYMQYGPAAQQALEAAKKLNPDNPRVYLLEGQDKFYTPEQFGGSKTEAKRLLEEAQKKYETFKPESSIHPTWGAGQTKYFLNQIK